MNDYPYFIKVNGKKYSINTDFRVALECDNIVRSNGQGKEYETLLALIYKLFGEECLDDVLHDKIPIDKVIRLAELYLWCGRTEEELTNDKEPSMNFKQDIGYIRASFMSDYQIDLDHKKMHWWQFNDYLRGTTEDSILNRVRYVREESLKGKKGEELQRWIEMKKNVALKVEKTEEQKRLDKLFEEKMKKEVIE